MPMTEKERNLQEIGQSAYESIAEMVAALECDYERLRALRDERADLDDSEQAEWDESNGEELKELIEAAGERESRDDAEQRIQEDPLSVEIRSGWVTPGEPMTGEEFVILLGTGGPAVRIRGELDQYGEPDRAWLETQDWFTPWTQFIGASQETLLTYCRQFYFQG